MPFSGISSSISTATISLQIILSYLCLAGPPPTPHTVGQAVRTLKLEMRSCHLLLIMYQWDLRAQRTRAHSFGGCNSLPVCLLLPARRRAGALLPLMAMCSPSGQRGPQRTDASQPGDLAPGRSHDQHPIPHKHTARHMQGQLLLRHHTSHCGLFSSTDSKPLPSPFSHLSAITV